MTPKSDLATAAFYCAPGALKRALRDRQDPNQTDPKTGRTPLMWLCEMFDHHYRSRKRMFRLLVKAGAKLELKDHTGMTALDIARWGSSRKIREYVEQVYQRRRVAEKINSRR